MSDWTPVEQVAKDDNGNYMALVSGKWVPATAGAKNDAGEYVAQLQTTQQQLSESKGVIDSLSDAKTWFGEGPQKGMSLMQRFRRVGEAGLAGAALGGGIGALAGGVGAGPGAGIGALGGVLGEVGEQVGAETGLQRGGQVLTGMIAGAPAGLADALTTAGKKAIPAVASFIPGTTGFALRRFINKVGAEEGLDPSVVMAVRAAQQRLGEGGEQASRQFGEATQKAFGTEKQTFESAAQEARKRAEDFASQVNKAQNQKEQLYFTQAEQAHRQLANTLDQGIGKGSSSFDLGNKIRNTIYSINNPEAAARTEAYKTSRNAAMESAAQKEAQGEFWAGSPEALKVRDKWLEIANNSEESVKNDITKIINQIWKQKQQTKTVQEPVPGFGDTYTQSKAVSETVPEYAPATKMDEIIRMLGQVYEKEAPEGFKAIGAANARQLRKDLSQGINKEGGFYDWSGLGEAKAGYKAASEELGRFESKRGESILGKQFGVNVHKTDAESLAKSMLGSESGVREFTNMVRDPKVVSEYLDDYVRGQVAGKSPTQVQKWLDDNRYVEKYLPQIRQEITDYAGKAGILERQAGQFTQAAKTASKSTLSPFVNKSAQQYVDKLGILGADGTMMDANKILDNVLSSKFSGAKMEEVGRLIGDQPGMKDNMLNAVALRLSKTSPHRVMAEFDALEPAIRGFRGIGDEDIAMMKSRLQQVVDSAQKAPNIQQTGSFKNALFGFGARSAGRSLLRPMITGRIDTEKDKK